MTFARLPFTARLLPAFILLAWRTAILPTKATGLLALTVLHAFSAGSQEGFKPDEHKNPDGGWTDSPLIQGRDGALYGVTPSGGVHGTGVLFKINPDGTGFTLLHSFAHLEAFFTGEPNKDGAWPDAALVQSGDGTLYGTTAQGGPKGRGTVFTLHPDGTAFQVLYAFGPKRRPDADGGRAESRPAGLTLGSDGLLYGAATFGGKNGEGFVFKLNPDSRSFQVVHVFPSVSYPDNKNDGGALPGVVPVFGQDGALYGTTNIGGQYGYGVMYRVTTDGEFAVLHQFQRKGAGFEANGVFPSGALTVGADGSFYGSARQGGRYDGGILYQTSADGRRFTVLHTFSDPNADSLDGSLPSAAPVFGQDGQLYGTAGGMGLVFRVAPDGAATSGSAEGGSKSFLLHDFSASDAHLHNAEGGLAQAELTLGRDGAFYGVASGGGRNGTVFRLTLPPAQAHAALSGLVPVPALLFSP